MFSRAPKVSFQVVLTIGEVTNVPLLTGVLYAKYKLKSGGSCKGETSRQEIKNHAVVFNRQVQLDVTMAIGKDTGVLSDCIFVVTIKKEVNGGQDSETLGVVTVNISEYAATRESSRKYLLQESKINSALKIKVTTMQTKGDPVFRVPEVPKSQLDFSNVDELIIKETDQAISKGPAGSSARSLRGPEFAYPTGGNLSPREDGGGAGYSMSLPIRPNSNRTHGLATSLGLTVNKSSSATLPRNLGTLTPSSESTSADVSPNGTIHRNVNRAARTSMPASPGRSDTGVSPNNSLPRKWNAEDIVDVAFSGKTLNIN